MSLQTTSIIIIGIGLLYLMIKDCKNNKRIKSLSNNIESISDLFDIDETLDSEENDLLTFKMKKITISIVKILKTLDKMKERITLLEENVCILENINECLETENVNLQKKVTMYKKLSKNMKIDKSFVEKL